MCEVRDLKPNGANIVVTEENKKEYVHLVCQMKMTGEWTDRPLPFHSPNRQQVATSNTEKRLTSIITPRVMSRSFPFSDPRGPSGRSSRWMRRRSGLA